MVDVLVAMQQQVPLTQKVQETIETPQLHFIDEHVDVPAVTQQQIDPHDLDCFLRAKGIDVVPGVTAGPLITNMCLPLNHNLFSTSAGLMFASHAINHGCFVDLACFTTVSNLLSDRNIQRKPACPI